MDSYLPNIIEGMQEDCEVLLLKYEKLKSLRFTDFAKIWKEMKFAGIYGNKQLIEIDMFVSEILFMVKQYFVKAISFNLKVGALYLLYGLYYKQPLKSAKKILVTYSDWLVIKEFLKDVREYNHFDTLLITYKLITDNAFLWSASKSKRAEVTPQQYFRYGLFDTNSLVDDVELENDFQELQEIEEQYIEAKAIAAEHASNPAYKMNINYCNNITEELVTILKEPSEDTPSSSMQDAKSIEKGETSGAREIDDIGARRKSLRHKSFKEKISPTKSTK